MLRVTRTSTQWTQDSSLGGGVPVVLFLCTKLFYLSKYFNSQRSKEEMEVAGQGSKILKPSVQILSGHSHGNAHSPRRFSANHLGLLSLQALVSKNHHMHSNVPRPKSLFGRPLFGSLNCQVNSLWLLTFPCSCLEDLSPSHPLEITFPPRPGGGR